MEKLVASEQNKLLKLGLAVQQSSLSSSDTQSLYMMVVNTYLCTSLEDMVGHKLGEFAPTRTYKGHLADDKKTRR